MQPLLGSGFFVRRRGVVIAMRVAACERIAGSAHFFVETLARWLVHGLARQTQPRHTPGAGRYLGNVCTVEQGKLKMLQMFKAMRPLLEARVRQAQLS
ncbi:hypothetical protein D3C80_841290 [compost metagenome]